MSCPAAFVVAKISVNADPEQALRTALDEIVVESKRKCRENADSDCGIKSFRLVPTGCGMKPLIVGGGKVHECTVTVEVTCGPQPDSDASIVFWAFWEGLAIAAAAEEIVGAEFIAAILGLGKKALPHWIHVVGFMGALGHLIEKLLHKESK